MWTCVLNGARRLLPNTRVELGVCWKKFYCIHIRITFEVRNVVKLSDRRCGQPGPVNIVFTCRLCPAGLKKISKSVSLSRGDSLDLVSRVCTAAQRSNFRFALMSV